MTPAEINILSLNIVLQNIFCCRMKKHQLITLLRQVRLDANLTQASLAERLGQTQSYVSKYESGEQRLDLIELEAICEAVDISLIKFMERYLES